MKKGLLKTCLIMFVIYLMIGQSSLSLFSVSAVSNDLKEGSDSLNSYYDEDYRPQFHFTPEKNWMNDPNGMVYLDGEYHLFYQHNPTEKVWGSMYWGHAISKDLVNWEHQPIALFPDENGFIWSGSVVVDYDNTSGFQTGKTPPLIAVFSYELGNENQTVGIAYSNDKGRTWEKYEGNPIINMPEETKVSNGGDGVFRDPKVFWYEEEEKWIFVIATGKQVDFYSSKNLKEWKKEGRFETPEVNGDLGIWECTDLINLPVDTTGDGLHDSTKWVLITSVANGPTGGQSMGYFIGDFDGTEFIPDKENIKWLNYGADMYAGVTWSNTPNNRPILLSWMSTPQYAGDTPTDPWRSAMTIPRELKLKQSNNEMMLTQTPVEELEDLRDKNQSWSNELTSSSNELLSSVEGDSLEIIAEIDMTQTTADEIGFKVRKGDGEYTSIGVNRKKEISFVDRTNSGIVDFHSDFAAKHTAPYNFEDEIIKLHILIDRSSVEVFLNDGEIVFTEQIFPNRNSKGVELFGDEGDIYITNLEIFQLNSATFTPSYEMEFKRSFGFTPSEIDVDKLPEDIENPNFETGDLTGWFPYGSAFEGVVTDQAEFWGGPFKHEGTYHLWGFAGAKSEERSDVRAGIMTSSLFRLGGDGTIDFLIAGGDDIERLYVSLVRASDGKELFRETGRDSEQYERVTWDASNYLGEAMYLKVVDMHSGRFGHINLDDIRVNNSSKKEGPHDIENPSFETGDLTGWTVVRGNAFSDASITDETDFWNKQPFNQNNLWHIWGGGGDNSKVGVMRSQTFTLGGDGQIDFLIGGDHDIDNLYVALIRESDGEIVLKETGHGNDTYRRVHWDASAYVGDVYYIEIVDKSTEGHLNLDDVNVPPTPSLHKNIEPAIYNSDFEYTRLHPDDIWGWEVISGDAYGPDSLVNEKYWSEGGTFDQEGKYHLWGYKAAGDEATGELHSDPFILSGNGGIDFLIGGGDDIDRLYVALVRVSDGEVLFKATGRNSETFQRVFWDASNYLGEEVFIKIVDDATGPWGHINVDDFNVYNSKFSRELLGHWAFDEKQGTTVKEKVTDSSNSVHYFLNKGVYQPARDPMWRDDGIENGALLFDGYSTWIESLPNQTPVLEDEITLEAWVAPRNFEHGDEGRLSAIINQHNREEKEGFILGHFRHGTWGLQFGTGDDWFEVMSDTLLPREEWSYVTATYVSSTGEAVLYLNGEKVASADLPQGAKIKPSSNPLKIGKNNDGMWLYGFTLNMFSGIMDEVKLRGRALSAEEVRGEYDRYIMQVNGNLPTPNLRIDRSILENDPHRPQYHAAPPVHWQNEPGGPFYFNGQYHVFYQSNPRGPYWNHIRWGHLVSDDMIHWRDVEDAIVPGRHDVDPDGAWAGDAVVDDFGNPVIFYTAGDDRKTPNQRINIARSTFGEDGDPDLNRWVKHPEVILDQKPGQGIMGEFRDPYVFKDGDTWFMFITSGVENESGDPVGGTALVYSTQDSSFENWDYRGELLVGDYEKYPFTGRVWELPIFLPLGDSGKHILLINPAKMEREQYQSRYTWYWIGTWDKEEARFIPDDEEPKLIDYGDYFTGPAGFVTPDGRTVIYSITQGRRTALIDYDSGYAHNFGLPLHVYLRDDDRLGIAPIEEVESLRGKQLVNITEETSFDQANEILSNVQGDMLEVQLELDQGLANEAGITVRRTPDGEEGTTLYYKKSNEEFWVDRTKSSLNRDLEAWYQGGNVELHDENVKLRVFIDRSMVEAYLNGLQNITTRAYPTRTDATGLQLWANENSETVVVKSLKVWEMNSAYKQVPATGVSLNQEKQEMMTGTNQYVTPIVSPQNATNKDVIWTSSNPTIATVTNGRVTAHAPGSVEIIAETRDGDHKATTKIVVIAPPPARNITNPSFEDGLEGWTILSGDAFSPSDVTDKNDWGWGGPFNHVGNYHFWSVNTGDDSLTGSMRSETFTLGGNGQINFLVSGGDNIYDLYVALVRESDGKILMKATGGNREAYSRVYWDAYDYIGTDCYILLVDNDTGGWGHINVDDFHVPVEVK
ncbi:GH32 C-terminal domain-containing protein [Halalkalibacter flavus]|uniref:GH32 C-terminal domain-containing protein n=1 Tax=Halalkalibacter flavus TaxID=3090668 RepID=UPI002FCA0EBC